MEKRTLPNLSLTQRAIKKIRIRKIRYGVKVSRFSRGFKTLLLRGIALSLGFRIGWYIISTVEKLAKDFYG